MASLVSGAGTERQVPGTEVFQPIALRHIQIEIKGPALEQLRRENRRDVPCSVREGGKTYEEVAIHLKGAAGSFRGLDDRPALTLNFDKFNERQTFYGLDKIHLNNSVQDPSLLTENICGDLFRQAGVPTPRACNVRVSLNGRDLGIYVLKEGFDKTFLRQYFTNVKGNLYDGGFLRDVTDDLEKTSGDDPSNRKDLKALAAAARERDLAKRWERLHQVLEVDKFIRYCALEVICWDWDGYPVNRNNYRLYSDPSTGRFTFFPHGMDQMFWEPNGPWQVNFNGLIARAVMETPQGRQQYRERMVELLTNVFQVEAVTQRIDTWAQPIRAALGGPKSDAARNYDGQVQRLRNLVRQRAASLARQLALPVPGPAGFTNGVARPTAWRLETRSGDVAGDETRAPDGRKALRLAAKSEGVVSWRAEMTLPPGRYQFEGAVRTRGIKSDGGVCLRISGVERAAMLKSADAWRTVKYEFHNREEGEVTLVCELKADAGEAWFDIDSLRILKLP